MPDPQPQQQQPAPGQGPLTADKVAPLVEKRVG
jgi:hypothetical protein